MMNVSAAIIVTVAAVVVENNVRLLNIRDVTSTIPSKLCTKINMR